jgi:hypothetical protein
MSRQGSPPRTKLSVGSAVSNRRNSPVPSSGPAAPPQASTISYEEVAAHAYALFLARGGHHGDDWRDWFQAETELRHVEKDGRLPSPQ